MENILIITTDLWIREDLLIKVTALFLVLKFKIKFFMIVLYPTHRENQTCQRNYESQTTRSSG